MTRITRTEALHLKSKDELVRLVEMYTDKWHARSLECAKLETQRDELLAAAVWLNHLYHGVGKGGGEPMTGEWGEAWEELRAAIARAEGASDEDH